MKTEDLDRAQILSFLNTPALDEGLSAALDSCLEEFCSIARPRSVWKLFDVSVREGATFLGELPLKGKDIARHLAGCERAVLAAATMSSEVDTLIRRESGRDMTRALMFDAIAGAALERVLDELEQQLRETLPYPYFTPRFSAGYGDFPLSQQSALVSMLDAPRKIGLTVTPAQTLLPMKSATALIGLSYVPTADARKYSCQNSCALCPHRDGCNFQKSEQNSSSQTESFAKSPKKVR